jgi:1-acyl-sn-glycerol-3-phosphate acyltransferase
MNTVPPAMPDDVLSLLRPFERFAFRLMRWLNVSAAGALLQRIVLVPLVGLFFARRMQVRGLERLYALPRDASILLVANHRSFFDLWVLAWLLQRDPRLRRHLGSPVRANFYYENPLGLLICVLLSGGSMFPPFFRSAEKMPVNKLSLRLLIERLATPGQLVGFHPEGTRNKASDPYALLPAHPGAGELALKARPVIIPAFVNGLSNSLLGELWANVLKRRPITAVFGAPVDVSDFPAETRLSHHKRCADRLNQHIAALGEEEKLLRAQLAS